MTVTQADFCKLTILVIWTGVPLHGQRKEPEQMLQQHERSEFVALHSPHASKMDCLDLNPNKKHDIHRPFKPDQGTWTSCFRFPCLSASRLFQKKSAQKKHETPGCRQGVTSRSHKITLPPGHISTTDFNSMMTKAVISC